MNQTTDFGTVTFDGKTYELTTQADFTNRVLPYNPDNDLFEMSAHAVDESGTEYTVYWIFREIPDAELDAYDYDEVDRVVER